MEYSKFKPTVFDNHYEIEGREDWLVVPVMRGRDSRSLERSNFIVAAKMFGIMNVDDATIHIPGVEIHRFGHWMCGWFEILIVEPTPENEVIVDDIVAALEDYPVLDESHYSRVEWTALLDYWDGLSGIEKASYRYRDYKMNGEVPPVGMMAESFENDMFGEV